LLSQGLPVKIKDKSLGDKLVALVKKIDSKFDPETFPEKVDAYLDRERERVKKYPNAAQLMDDAMDRVGAIMALFEVYYPKTLKDWKTVVDRIFTESEYTSAINLYSIHSGKGGEGKDVIILNPQSMPLIYKGMTRSQRNQEDNLLYVALTRAIECLTVVIEKDAADNDIWPSWVPERMRVFS
jgi:superfamily I DNA/RNA helicase